MSVLQFLLAYQSPTVTAKLLLVCETVVHIKAQVSGNFLTCPQYRFLVPALNSQQTIVIILTLTMIVITNIIMDIRIILYHFTIQCLAVVCAQSQLIFCNCEITVKKYTYIQWEMLQIFQKRMLSVRGHTFYKELLPLTYNHVINFLIITIIITNTILH